MNGTFSSQLGGVASAFEQWGACERTVAACALARRVPWPGLRLLQRAVEAALSEQRAAAAPADEQERDANDEALLAGLLAACDTDRDDEAEERLRRLATLLPLLRPDNARGRELYTRAAAPLVRAALASPTARRADHTRQLLSYLLVHPALEPHDQRTLTQWLRYLENHISGGATEPAWPPRPEPALCDANIWGGAGGTGAFRRTVGKNIEFRGADALDALAGALQESFSENGRDVDISLEGDQQAFDAAVAQPKAQRSNSLTPPAPPARPARTSSSAEDLADEPFVQKPRSFSLSSEHSLAQARPLGAALGLGTAGSETRLDRLRGRGAPAHPGMACVALWLKGLRLHKYVWLFTNISYERMMAIDDDYLEKLGVTKGARHKILLSIHKLGEREAALRGVAAELRAGAPPAPAALARCLERLRALLLSPMPPGGRLADGLLQALRLASDCVTQTPPAGAGAGAGAAGAERAPPGEAPVDPLSLHCWLVERALHHEAFSAPEHQAALRALRHRLPPRQFFHHVCELPRSGARHPFKPKWRATHSGFVPGAARSWPAQPPAAPPPAPRGKSHSYPPFPPAPARAPPRAPPACDDYPGLDALCLQMTEQAIN